MDSVCRSKNNPKPTPAPPQDSEGAVFDALCTVTDSGRAVASLTVPCGQEIHFPYFSLKV